MRACLCAQAGDLPLHPNIADLQRRCPFKPEERNLIRRAHNGTRLWPTQIAPLMWRTPRRPFWNSHTERAERIGNFLFG